MSYFVLICRDKPNCLQTRLDTRADHLAYLTTLNEKGILKIAGPMLGDDDKPCGSLIIVDVADLSAAQEIASNDPYQAAGLFQEVEIKPYNWVLNAPEAL